MAKAHPFFDDEARGRILEAVRQAEAETLGEIVCEAG